MSLTWGTLQGYCTPVSPLRPRCARPPLPQGEARGAATETVLRPPGFRAARELAKKSFLTNAAPDAGRGLCTSVRGALCAKTPNHAKKQKVHKFLLGFQPEMQYTVTISLC